jgi:hypothetical protein
MSDDTTNPSRCPSCGAAVADQAACEALFNQIGARAFTDARLAAVQQLVVDAYCLQHPEPYCHSAKSYAAHLTRMCIGLEMRGDTSAYAAIPRWLNGSPSITRPQEPNFRGKLTIADLAAAGDVEEHKRITLEWAQEVWQAYAAQHELARKWIAEALAAGGGRGTSKKRR